jgi:hypothetical protein
MAEMDASLTDQVLTRVPVRQWMLSVPKRERWYRRHRPETVSPVLRILLRAVETALRRASPDTPTDARFGAVASVHHFGAALNEHTHFHRLITVGLFCSTAAGEAVFHEADSLTDIDLRVDPHSCIPRLGLFSAPAMPTRCRTSRQCW